MAYFGVSNVVIAKLVPETEKYTGGTILEAVGTSVTPEFSQGKFYCDNKLGRNRTYFKQANVTAEVGTIPLKVAEMMYGHTLSKEGKALTSKTTDKTNYVGYGFSGCEAIDDDTDIFTACWIPKVAFEEGEDSFTTRGDQITFTSQKMSGVAVGLKDAVWRDVEQFDTEAEALTWLKEKACITE